MDFRKLNFSEVQLPNTLCHHGRVSPACVAGGSYLSWTGALDSPTAHHGRDVSVPASTTRTAPRSRTAVGRGGSR